MQFSQQTSGDETENLPDRPTCCPSTVAYRWVILREYPPKGRCGSSVRVMGTEMLMGPESSSRRGAWVLERAWPLVTTMLSGVVDSFRPCFIVSFSDTQKSSSLKRSRKVFQSWQSSGSRVRSVFFIDNISVSIIWIALHANNLPCSYIHIHLYTQVHVWHRQALWFACISCSDLHAKVEFCLVLILLFDPSSYNLHSLVHIRARWREGQMYRTAWRVYQV